MVAARDKRMRFNTADEKKDREDLVSLAKPQGVVDAMAWQDCSSMPSLFQALPIMVTRQPRPVPTFGMKNGQGKPTGR
jgi:hypothetical protein